MANVSINVLQYVCGCGLMKLIYIGPCYAKGCGIEGEFALPRVYKEDPEGD